MAKAWTNHEIRRLVDAHADGKPSFSDLAELFPRRTKPAIEKKAAELGLRLDPTRPNHRMLRIANEYLARRRSGMPA